MKVLHITESLGGGTQSAIRTFTTVHPAQHSVLGRQRSGEDTGGFGSGVRLMAIDSGILGFLREARRLCRDLEPDVVHLHSSFAGICRVVVPRRTRLVYSPHCYAFERRDVGALMRKLLRSVEWWLSRRQQVIASVSPHESDLARSLVGKKSQVVLTPNVSSFERTEPPALLERQHIVTCGRLGPQKDPTFFAAFASALRVDLPDAEITWIGDGEPEERQRLEALGVSVTGWVGSDAISRILRTASLYVHTARWESSPYALLDAARSGVPVLARRIPSLESLGYSTVDGGPAELARYAATALQDTNVRAQITAATRQVDRANSADALAGALRQAYGSALRPKSS